MSTARHQLSSRGDRILRALLDHPNASTHEIAGECGIPYNSVRLELRKLLPYIEVLLPT